MAGIGIVLAIVVIAGLPVAILFDARRSAGRLAGEAFVLGNGVIAFVLLGLSTAGIPWTRMSVGVSLATAVGGLAFLAALRGRGFHLDAPASTSSTADRIASALLDCATAALVAGHALIATLASIPEIDFWAIWGLKGRVFFERGGIDWKFLADAGNAFAHQDYPPLLPLNYAFASLVRGGWEDRWIGVLSTAFAAAAILIVRDMIGRETGRRWMAALGANILAPLALSRWIGTAEPAMIAYSAAGLLLIRRGVATDSRSELSLGAIFLGLAAFTKNEGLALVAAAAIGLLVFAGARWRNLLALWPAAAIALPWIALRTFRGITTDFASAFAIETVIAGLRRIGEVAEQLALNMPAQPLFWAAVLITLLLMTRQIKRGDMFLLVAVGVQAIFFIGAYLITPYELAWHISQSWSRILEQLALPLGFLAFVLLMNQFSRATWNRSETPTHAVGSSSAQTQVSS